MLRPVFLSASLVSLFLFARSGDDSDGSVSGSGGNDTGAGSTTATGGFASTGGAAGTGAAASTGGAPNSGGATSSGGAAMTGGSGGEINAGGTPGIGGAASGGDSGVGGSDAAGGTGSGGDGSGGGAATLVEPVERSGKYVLEFGETLMEIDPAIGARITTFSYGGTNVLFGTGSGNSGSTYWTSPQATWDWPPPEAVDSLAYTGAWDGTTLTLTGAESALGDTTVVVEKSFTPNVTGGYIDVVYTLINTGSVAVSAAGWEISRVALGGISFFPEGPGGTAASPNNNLLPTAVDGAVVWFDEANAGYRSATDNDGNNKMNGDGLEGWIAHAAGTLLFVKSFADVAQGGTAPDHGELELYASSTGDYVEVENQGTHGAIAGGASSSYSVRWALRPLVASPAAVGDALVAEARAVVATIGNP